MRKITSEKTRRVGKTSPKHWRITALVFFVCFISVAIVGKLFVLQVLAHAKYADIAQRQHEMRVPIEAERGEIFMQDEVEPYPLAVNRQMQLLFAVPREIKNAEEASQKIAEITGIAEEEIREKLQKPDDMYEVIKRKLSDEEAARIKEAKLAGIYLQPESYRYYPGGELGSQLVGFVGSDGKNMRGMYGLESFWQDKLAGSVGMVKQKGDSRGRWISISDRETDPAKDGNDLMLTVNHTVQYEVEKILRSSLEKYAADSGSVVVMEAKTGRILAMANAPGFDPNQYATTEDISLFSNAATSQPYEPGSVFKPLTVAMGLDCGKISPNTTYIDTGIVKEAGFDIQNSDLKANGLQTMTQVLEKSLNTGVIYIEKLVGNKVFGEYVKKFGFGEKTGIELPNESVGNIKNLESLKTTINFFTASFGQGIMVTPLQLAVAYGALANEGMMMKPTIIESIRHSDGSVEKIEPQEIRQVVSTDAAKQVGEMLRSVVVNGHGKRADVPGYLVGGKTGTAQVAKVGSKGYEEGTNIGSFAGYAPINDPQFVVVVDLYDPKNVEWAESSAAPTFGEVMKFLLEYYRVKPTEDPSTSPLAKMAPISTATVQGASTTTVDNNKDKKENKKNTH